MCVKAWRNQARNPVNARTCKHLREVLGDAYENARLLLKNPSGQSAGPSKKISNNKGKANTKSAKRKKPDDEEQSNANKRPKKQRSANDEEGEHPAEEDDEQEEEADAGAKAEVKVLLAVKWDMEKGVDPTGWWVSEKLDGVRYVLVFFISGI